MDSLVRDNYSKWHFASPLYKDLAVRYGWCVHVSVCVCVSMCMCLRVHVCVRERVCVCESAQFQSSQALG